MADVRFTLVIKGQLSAFLAQLPDEYARSTTNVVRRKAASLKRALRRDVVRAGLGVRLGNAIRDQIFPRRGRSLRARGRVFSRAIVGKRGQRTDLITLFEEGAVIRPLRRKFLAIPTAEAGIRRMPALWPRGSLFVRSSRQSAILVHEDQPNVPLFVLVRQVRIRRRLNVRGISERQLRNTDVLLARDMERRASRLAKKLSA